MKKIIVLLAVCVIASASFAGTLVQMAVGTSHSVEFGCETCHNPHTSTGTDAPMWGKTSGTTTAAYAAPSDAMQLTPAAPAGTSLLCMSCHDGVTTAGAVTGKISTADSDPGVVDTSTTHPISIDYTALSDLGTNYVAAPAAGFLADDTTVECSSCHDIHKSVVDSQMRTASGSSICADCHIK